MKQDIRIDVSRCKSAAVGAQHGVTPTELRAIEPRIAAGHEVMRRERATGERGFYDLYKQDAVFDQVEAEAQRFLAMGYDNFVVLGIGGSALGTTALVTALKPPYYNLLSKRARGGLPRIFVMDNIDPVTFHRMMRLCPPKKTLYNVISKKAETPETLLQMMIVVDALERTVGASEIKKHLVITTGPREAGENALHHVVEEFGLTSFVVPVNVGGRFSAFSPVGMFPTALLCMDLREMRRGCAAMDAQCSVPDLKTNPAYLRAAVQYLANTQKGKVMSVMMPYSDALRDMADWYRQLWAESLGKRFSLDQQEVFVGQTPIKALGVTDQHSQIQLYREGPNDKIINILEVARFDKTVRIPEVLQGVAEMDYLRGHTMNIVMAAELQGTLEALKESQRPVSRIVLPRVNAYAVAQLLYLLEVETAMAGQLYKVDAFVQPGVVKQKETTKEILERRKGK